MQFIPTRSNWLNLVEHAFIEPANTAVHCGSFVNAPDRIRPTEGFSRQGATEGKASHEKPRWRNRPPNTKHTAGVWSNSAQGALGQDAPVKKQQITANYSGGIPPAVAAVSPVYDDEGLIGLAGINRFQKPTEAWFEPHATTQQRQFLAGRGKNRGFRCESPCHRRQPSGVRH